MGPQRGSGRALVRSLKTNKTNNAWLCVRMVFDSPSMRAQPYSGWMPAAFATFAHFSVSALR